MQDAAQPDMNLAITVKYKDGTTHDVVAEFIDFIGFEATWKRSVRVLEQEIRLSDWSWLAWSVLTREKLTTLRFNPEWLLTVLWCGENTNVEQPLLKQRLAPEGVSTDLSDGGAENPLDMIPLSG